MEFSVICACAAVGAVSVLKLISKKLVDNGGEPLALLAFYSIVAATILAFTLPWDSLASLSLYSTGLLCCSGLAWTFACFFAFQAYKYISVSEGEVVHTLKLILTAFAGAFLFGERCGLPEVLGGACVVGAIVLQQGQIAPQRLKGVLYMVGASFSGAAGVVLAKCLAESVPLQLVAFAGFAIPAVLYTLAASMSLKELLTLHRSCGLLVISLPIFAVGEYYLVLEALRWGEAMSTVIILQSTPAVVFLVEVLVLRARELRFRPAFSASLCLAGAVVVCTFG